MRLPFRVTLPKFQAGGKKFCRTQQQQTNRVALSKAALKATVTTQVSKGYLAFSAHWTSFPYCCRSSPRDGGSCNPFFKFSGAEKSISPFMHGGRMRHEEPCVLWHGSLPGG